MTKVDIEKHTEDLFRNILKNLEPPKRMNLTEWADENRVISSGTASESGRWRTSRTPYMKDIMNSVTDPEVREVGIMSSAQVGKSELIMNAIGYFAHNDPTAIILSQPTVESAEDFSKERLAPMIRDTKVLNKIFNGKNGSNNVLKKIFAGGMLAVIGANSPVGLASRPIQVLLCDEIDRYPTSARNEGDPVTLMTVRTKTYTYTRKHVFVSTPTIAGTSRIEKVFLSGTQSEYNVPCPACGEYHEIKWENIDYELVDGMLSDKEVLHYCEHCGEFNNELMWKKGLIDGKWVNKVENKTVKTFHLSALLSPWQSWRETVQHYLDAGDDEDLLKVFYNTDLGIPWQVDGKSLDHSSLFNRRTEYGQQIPDEVVLLTMGVDVQENRFELEVVGYDVNKRSYGIEYLVIPGDTSLDKTWDKLEAQIKKIYYYDETKTMKISSTCIDSGYRADMVYKFCKKLEHLNVWATKGRGGFSLPSIAGFVSTKKVKNILFTLGVDTIKSNLFAMLMQEDELGQGYCFFPTESNCNYDEKYFQGLTSETRVVTVTKNKVTFEWQKKSGVRNEPLDCRVYNLAAYEILNPNLEKYEKAKQGRIKKKRRRVIVNDEDLEV